MSTISRSSICRYYLRGTCRFGDTCRFDHAIPFESSTESVNVIQNNQQQQQQQQQQVPSPPPQQQQQQQQQQLASELSHLNNINNSVSILNVKAKPFVPKSHKIDLIKNDNNNNGNNDLDLPISPTPPPPPLLSTTIATNEKKSYAEVVGAVGGGRGEDVCCDNGGIAGGGGDGDGGDDNGDEASGGSDSDYHAQSSTSALCPYEDDCPYGEYCGYLHPEYCDMCCQYRLHPTDNEQRRRHKKECIQRHEKDMELSFAIARSQDKTCGVCFDTIVEKSGREQRFGILPNCNHVFCLECIRTWRQATQFEHKITRACPECRTPSDYVCPSAYWVETKEEKDKLLNDYKAALGEKDCKYFNKGEGKCPFGNKCFYKHALPNGVKVDVGLPPRPLRKVQRHTGDELFDLFDIYLWDFVDQRNMYWLTYDHPTDSDTDSSDYD